MMKQHNYFVYILTNLYKTVLYICVTNNLEVRVAQHCAGANHRSFTKKYQCFYLVHYECYQYINDAIAREKELKGWSRAKKEILIRQENPNWKFLNEEIKDS